MIKKYRKILIIAGLAVITITVGITWRAKAQDTLFLGFTSEQSFDVVSSFRGYQTKSDPTNTSPDMLVSGSQNVIINDQEKIETRAGYTLFGAASTTARAIASDFTWKNSGATSSAASEIFLRESNGTLQFFATSTFEDLLNGLSTSTPTRFTTAWSPTELIDELLFVSASSTLYEWSGAQGTLASTTSTSIGINETLGESRFLIAGTRQIRVKDTSGIWQTFTYTINGASTFGSVTPDPTTFTFGTNASVVQAVRSNINTPQAGYVATTIKVLQNQIFVGSANSRRVFISSNTDFTDYTFSSPRIAGEGSVLTLDDTTIGFEYPDDKKMIIFSGRDRVYQVTFEISPGSTADREVPRVRPLLVSSGQGAVSQELIGKIKEAVVWVSNNDELVELGQIENLTFSQAVAISDPIKPDFINANFTNGEIEFWRNSIFITAPSDGKVFIYDTSKQFWQPPQIIGIRRLSQFQGNLYGHGQSVPETYKLFTGLNDNNNPISFKAHFAYRNSGDRTRLKNFNRYFTELYLSSNTKVTVSLVYEWLGAKSIISYELDGSDDTFLFSPTEDASLGVNSLGTNPLGSLTSASDDLPKYRRFKPTVPIDHFEYQVRFETEDDDAAFQLVSSGANISLSNNLPVSIIK